MQIHVTVEVDLFSNLLNLHDEGWIGLWEAFQARGMAEDEHVAATIDLDDCGRMTVEFFRMQ